MSEPRSAIFNQKAAKKLRSPDDLDNYVRVTNPSVWVVLGACAALLIGLLAWGIFGAVTTSVSATGTSTKGGVVCLLGAEDVANVDVGDEASVGGVLCRVVEVADVPLSRDEARDLLGSDYLVDSLIQENWAYRVDFDADPQSFAAGVPLNVNITVERVAPISLILGSGN